MGKDSRKRKHYMDDDFSKPKKKHHSKLHRDDEEEHFDWKKVVNTQPELDPMDDFDEDNLTLGEPDQIDQEKLSP